MGFQICGSLGVIFERRDAGTNGFFLMPERNSRRNTLRNMNINDEATLSGTFVVLPTPFTDEDTVDTAGLENVLDYVLKSGAEGVVFPGLASEYEQLSKEERLSLTQYIGERMLADRNFIVGASAANPADANNYLVAGANAGAKCAMVMAPSALAGDLNAIIEFFQTLAESAEIPIMLQNAPAPMGAALSVNEVAKVVAAVPAIEYVKEEIMPCGQRMEHLLELAPSHLRGVFGGAGGRYIIDELERGSLGTIPASELTEVHVELVRQYRAGNLSAARRVFYNMLPILNMQSVLRCSLTKEVLRRRGLIANNNVRVPGPVMDQKDIDELCAAWANVEDIAGPIENSELESACSQAT